MNNRSQRYATKWILSTQLTYDLQFKVNKRDLELCSLQGPSLPKSDPVHPLLGKRVSVKHGQRKGYSGSIVDVGSMAVTVELDALIAGSSSARQNYKWSELRDL